MGELFDGAFALWTRTRPRIAFGAVGVSPHLLAVESYPAYDRAYQDAIGTPQLRSSLSWSELAIHCIGHSLPPGTKCASAIHDLLQTVSHKLKLSPENNTAFQVLRQPTPSHSPHLTNPLPLKKQCSGWDMHLPDPEFMYVVSTILFGNMDADSGEVTLRPGLIVLMCIRALNASVSYPVV